MLCCDDAINAWVVCSLIYERTLTSVQVLQMINWDGRLDAVMNDIVDPARQPLTFAAGQIRSVLQTCMHLAYMSYKASA